MGEAVWALTDLCSDVRARAVGRDRPGPETWRTPENQVPLRVRSFRIRSALLNGRRRPAGKLTTTDELRVQVRPDARTNDVAQLRRNDSNGRGATGFR